MAYKTKFISLVIPDYARMSWIVRAPTWKETEALYERVNKCFQWVQGPYLLLKNDLTYVSYFRGAALATDTRLTVKPGIGQYDLAQNEALGRHENQQNLWLVLIHLYNYSTRILRHCFEAIRYNRWSHRWRGNWRQYWLCMSHLYHLVPAIHWQNIS